MKKFLILVTILLSMNANAEELKAPTISAVEAINLADEYISANNIDISKHAIIKIEYKGFYNDNENPHWEVRYDLLQNYVLDGFVIIKVYPDKKIQVNYGG